MAYSTGEPEAAVEGAVVAERPVDAVGDDFQIGARLAADDGPLLHERGEGLVAGFEAQGERKTGMEAAT